jgi:HD-GYP domain-containing protein (c-di-GMP phosphodiesterase class II)
MAGDSPPEQLRVAEVIGALCLATDLGVGLPFEHGLQSTLVAMRLAERVGVDRATAEQAYFGCLLFYAGCTADADMQAALFAEGALVQLWSPVMFGSARQNAGGVLRALAAGDGAWPVRALRAVGKFPAAVSGHRAHVAALCEVAQMLGGRLGLPDSVSGLFVHLTERWDGKGPLRRLRGEQIPLAIRIVHVARDATLHLLLGDAQYVAGVIRSRSGGAFDPAVVDVFTGAAGEILDGAGQGSVWDAALAAEPPPQRVLRGAEVDEALLAIAAFADLIAPHLVGHSSGVADLAAAAARHAGRPDDEVTAVWRAALVHDVGRVGVPFGVWHRPGALTADEWEKVRLHPYHSERVLSRSPALAALAGIASGHHERLDGGGYHRGTPAAGQPLPARLLAAADAYHAMTEARPHRPALSPQDAAAVVRDEARTGRLDPDCVAAVLGAAGHRPAAITRPAGLTAREAAVLTHLARGMATKQIARARGITAKTADHYVQQVYAKIGVSTRAAAAVYAMQHGLTTWENSR